MKSNKKLIIAITLLLLIAAFFMSGNKKIVSLDEAAKKEKVEEIVEHTEEAGEEKKASEELEIEEEEVTENKKEVEEEVEKEKKEVELVAKTEEDKKEEKAAIVKEDKASKSKKDKYLTDPVPAGKPKPQEWQELEKDLDTVKKATLSVTCKSIVNNIDLLDKSKLSVLPEDGIIYASKEVEFHPGESVFDVLLREMKDNKIHMEFVMTPMYNSAYVEGINNLYEFDCGELSGWMYKVNDWFPNYGASRYALEEGDVIEWIYTCDLGRDIGGGQIVGGE